MWCSPLSNWVSRENTHCFGFGSLVIRRLLVGVGKNVHVGDRELTHPHRVTIDVA